MQRVGPKLLLSATDLVNFHECEHLSALELAALDDHTKLLFKRGNEFEAAYLAKLKQQ